MVTAAIPAECIGGDTLKCCFLAAKIFLGVLLLQLEHSGRRGQ